LTDNLRTIIGEPNIYSSVTSEPVVTVPEIVLVDEMGNYTSPKSSQVNRSGSLASSTDLNRAEISWNVKRLRRQRSSRSWSSAWPSPPPSVVGITYTNSQPTTGRDSYPSPPVLSNFLAVPSQAVEYEFEVNPYLNDNENEGSSRF